MSLLPPLLPSLQLLQVQSRSAFLIQALGECEKELDHLDALSVCPFPLSLLHTPTAAAIAATAEVSLDSGYFEDTHKSEMHDLSGYLDVAQDDIFSSAKYHWLTKAAYATSSQ